MVATAQVAQDLERDFRRIATELDDLPRLADEWDDAQESVRYDAEITWYDALVGLHRRLDPAYRAGQMTAEQAERYRVLLARLKAALPVIDQLGFARPRVSLEP